MKNKYVGHLATAACSLAATTALAADPGMRYDNPPPEANVFRSHEFTIDLFGSGSLGQESLEHISGERVENDVRIGAGVGANYFFTRHFGVSADAYTENTAHAFVDDVSGSLVFRLPFDSVRLAPYAFGGGGYQFDPIEQWFGHAGAGLEFRFHRNVGIFVDARYVFTEDSEDFGLGRLGVRFSF